MKRITFAVILTIVSILFSGYANAVVAHPENIDIVGGVFAAVCFNNDGAVAITTECNDTGVDEGFVYLDGGWRAGGNSGINACGAGAVSPVLSAACPIIFGRFADCTINEYVLVQTTKSGHFWALKSNSSCTEITTPETTGLVPCLPSDAFDPVTGCTATGNQPTIQIDGGYIQLDLYNGAPPPYEHCADSTHDGRMVFDDVNDLLYICTESGWISK